MSLVEERMVALGSTRKVQAEGVDIWAPANSLRAEHNVGLFLLVVRYVASCFCHFPVLVLCGAGNLVVVVGEGLVVGICALLALGCSFCIFGPRHFVLERLKVTVLSVDFSLESIDLSLCLCACRFSLFLLICKSKQNATYSKTLAPGFILIHVEELCCLALAELHFIFIPNFN